jgi:hypothetical protein
MTTIPNTTGAAAPQPSDSPLVRRPAWQSKWLLPAAAAVAYAGAWWVAGRLEVSSAHGFDGSLLAGGNVVANLIVAAVTVAAAVAMGTIVAGSIRPDAGLFAAGFALLALGNRGRTTVTVLHDAGGDRSIFLLLALELLILYALLGAAWWVIHRMQQTGRLHTDAARDGLADVRLPANAGWHALANQILIAAVVVIFIAQTEEKKQVVAAIGIGAFMGAFFPYWRHGPRPSIWYWAGPLAVGLPGYLFAFALPPVGIEIGRPDLNAGGILGSLARLLPLDYASMGTAGALLGYWMRRTSLREREIHEATAALPTSIKQRLQQAGS